MPNYRLITDSTDIEALDEDGVVVARIPDTPTAERAQYNDWLAAGNTPLPPVVPPPEPQPVLMCSDRQFYEQAAIDGLISEDEALASMEGVLPPTLDAAIATFPTEMQFGARMYFKGATVFTSDSVYIQAMAGFYGWSDERTDDFFRMASKIGNAPQAKRR